MTLDDYNIWYEVQNKADMLRNKLAAHLETRWDAFVTAGRGHPNHDWPHDVVNDISVYGGAVTVSGEASRRSCTDLVHCMMPVEFAFGDGSCINSLLKKKRNEHALQQKKVQEAAERLERETYDRLKEKYGE